ncbi:hypothetical protein [Clostridium sp. Cult2]|uniref:hypothetical protein n=1 Tax=Clostridium sp. Cult2 TaxID=2079003 RepID=UPI001F27472D|nr:hypothetical protein [Clostridium sp. Cult2]MCF6466133.1 hypothetical protein [Clostridium sp. Cult2]
MKFKEKITSMIILTTILWVVITICGWKGQYILGMILGVFLMLVYMSLGAAKEGALNKKLFMYPLMVWTILWVLSFILSDYHAKLFTGTMPSFTILGFHPSFAWTVLTYWIGGVLTLTLGFILYKDLWLSDEDWNNFKNKVGQMDGEKEVN